MKFNFKKFAMVFVLPAVLIYAGITYVPSMLIPYLGVAGQYAGAVASVVVITGVLYIYKKYISKKVE